MTKPSGEWLPASEAAERRAVENRVEVRDAVGNLLQDGDQVTLIKDLQVKGAGKTLRQGTLIKSIRLTGNARKSTANMRVSRGSSCGRNSSANARLACQPAPPRL